VYLHLVSEGIRFKKAGGRLKKEKYNTSMKKKRAYPWPEAGQYFHVQ